MDFKQEYMCEFVSTDREMALKELGRAYHIVTEAYDKMHCSGEAKGVAVPVTSEERQLVVRNARFVLEHICAIGKTLGFSDLEIFQMIRKMSRYA